MIIRVWNGAQLRRSIRAGIKLLIDPPVPAVGELVVLAIRASRV
jgi:hypothetical protein